MSIETGDISRRDFLKLCGSAALAYGFSEDIMDLLSEKEISFLENTPDEILAYTATDATSESIYYQTTAYIEEYFNNLGFKTGKYSLDAQVEFIERFNKEGDRNLISSISFDDIKRNSTLWNDIPAGTVMYFENEKNRYDDACIYMGIDSNNSPIFSLYHLGRVKNGVGLGEVLNKYSRKDKILLFDAVEASRKFDLKGGSIEPDKELFNKLGYDVVVTMNINDGTLGIWDLSDDDIKRVNEKDMFCVVGRRLKRNEFLSKDYMDFISNYLPYSMYDSLDGCHIESTGVRRRTYTPPIITDFQGTVVSEGFGHLGPESSTDICMLKQVYVDKKGDFVVSNRYSSYTLHEVPRGTNDQSILMREPQLINANKTGIPIENPNLSSGCVNMDRDSWNTLKDILNKYVKDGKKISVMFTTPNIKQRDLIRKGSVDSHFHSEDPFGAKAGLWGYERKDNIGLDKKDSYKRKNYPIFSKEH